MQVKTQLYSDKKPPNVEKNRPNVDKKGEKKRRPPQGDQPTDPPKGEAKRPPERQQAPTTEKRPTPPRRATTTRPRRREQRNNHKQQKTTPNNTMKNTIFFGSFFDVKERTSYLSFKGGGWACAYRRMVLAVDSLRGHGLAVLAAIADNGNRVGAIAHTPPRVAPPPE